ncbi:hypothetical protein AB1A81_16245 [Bdellovibrio bacteriovorus]|uniref:Uncharacterized protein n=1 Tax=Bdellovibrio bacteriovorus (strain ATCC 15356 / DSM 50701 / NCIMB 9529 / HD100) TaxID=264462 RepID=Q6MHK1_BDEBA|nr:hypothetical protein [Bdellovibrio bacteriovorus]CAE78331.1 hypothetical protein predicted by Glimmer/Critica [Bdellovibrio bacteriovorus HD100]
MGWWLLLPFIASADFAFTGKVVSLQKNPLKNNYLVRMESVDSPLEVDKGPEYLCLHKAMKSQDPVLFTFDARLFKIRTCKL